MRQTAWTLLRLREPELSPREHEADDVNETVQEPRVLESEAGVLESVLALTFP